MGHGLKPEIALYGALRSGTTLLRLMLDAHPQISCPGETDFIFDHLPPGATSATQYDPAVLVADRIYRSHMKKFPNVDLPEPTPDRFLDQIHSEGDVAILITHRRLDRMLQVYPDIPILHLVRDPRDVARSSIGMGWAENVYYGVDHWIRTEGEWQQHAGHLSPEQVLRVHYETLIREPEQTLNRICGFAGIPYDPQMLNYASSTTYDRPDPTLIEQWRRKQTQHEVGLIEGKIGPLLEQSGYEPSGYPKIVPDRIQSLAMTLRQKRFLWKTRLQRYGLRDSLIDAICRRTGLTGLPLAQNARRRIDAARIHYQK
jgi:hypothetical protein